MPLRDAHRKMLSTFAHVGSEAQTRRFYKETLRVFCINLVRATS